MKVSRNAPLIEQSWTRRFVVWVTRRFDLNPMKMEERTAFEGRILCLLLEREDHRKEVERLKEECGAVYELLLSMQTRAQTAEEVVELVTALNPDAVGGNDLALAAIKKARSALAPIEEGTCECGLKRANVSLQHDQRCPLYGDPNKGAEG